MVCGFPRTRSEFLSSEKNRLARSNLRCRLSFGEWSSEAESVKLLECHPKCLAMSSVVNEDLGKIGVLKIDKDCYVNSDWLKDYVRLVIVPTCQSFNLRVLSVRTCPSRKKGFHLYIDIDPPIEPDLANRLQWLLGDDCRRVDFNRARIRSGLREWNKLFEEPGRRLRTIPTTSHQGRLRKSGSESLERLSS